MMFWYILVTVVMSLLIGEYYNRRLQALYREMLDELRRMNRRGIRGAAVDEFHARQQYHNSEY